MQQSSQDIAVGTVAWDDPAAVVLRDALRTEIRQRYADRILHREGIAADMAVTAEAVVYTGVAFAPAGAGEPVPVGHVALRGLGDGTADVELKRMYVAPSHRGRGVSKALLHAVEQAATRLGAGRIVLQTGDRQPDAVHLYEHSGYTRIPIFAPYEALTYSNCFEKRLEPRR